MSMTRTPELSLEGTLEVLHELKHGPPDTPERRATLERVRAWQERMERLHRHDLPGEIR